MERSTIFKNGKPSISMDHLHHGYVSHNQSVQKNIFFQPTKGLDCSLLDSWAGFHPNTVGIAPQIFIFSLAAAVCFTWYIEVQSQPLSTMHLSPTL